MVCQFLLPMHNTLETSHINSVTGYLKLPKDACAAVSSAWKNNVCVTFTALPTPATMQKTAFQSWINANPTQSAIAAKWSSYAGNWESGKPMPTGWRW